MRQIIRIYERYPLRNTEQQLITMMTIKKWYIEMQFESPYVIESDINHSYSSKTFRDMITAQISTHLMVGALWYASHVIAYTLVVLRKHTWSNIHNMSYSRPCFIVSAICAASYGEVHAKNAASCSPLTHYISLAKLSIRIFSLFLKQSNYQA